MTETRNVKFQKLTPTKNVNLEIYENALNFAFSDNDIKNVAISGAYSAGKSSLLETYKLANPDRKFIHISLAHFEALAADTEKTPGCNDPILEGKILNQLIHQIPADKIPFTHFKVKQEKSKLNIAICTIIIVLFFILSSYILGFSHWCTFTSTFSKTWLKNIFKFTAYSGTLLTFGIIHAAMAGIIIYHAIKAQITKKLFKKVKLNNYEIEIFENKDESYFDKYLNEVLYLFEHSGADAIVFEDMDRFNSSLIFEKLREINFLVNNKIKEKKIRFFYLLRDDIFVSKDRTKFFDLIIPVVPVIDCSNSYDQFIKHFKDGGILEIFNQQFLQELSLYIDDMRILKNIYNEFVVYNSKLRTIQLDKNKLLAIIAYKNIFPRDFSELQLGMGYVHTIFANKNDYISAEIDEIDDKIRKIEDDIKKSKHEMLQSIDELDAVFLPFNYQVLYINNNRADYKTRVQLIKAMKENPDTVQCNNNNYHNTDTNFQELLKNPEYIERKKAIENKNTQKIDELNGIIEDLQKRKETTKNSRLSEIINKYNIDTIFNISYQNEIGEEINFEEIKTSQYFPLIKYLVRNGHIDETYHDYMTYFYENSLSINDKNFLRSITDEIPKEYSYQLKDAKAILERVKLSDFDHEEILNFDLLNYLLETKETSTEYFNRLLKQLIETRNFNFIGEFLQLNKNVNLFIESINREWPQILKYMLNESNFSEVQIKQYVIHSLYYSSIREICIIDNYYNLSIYISRNSTFLNISNPNIEKLISVFKALDVKFSWIEHGTANENLFKAVYDNSIYRLNIKCISLMLEVIYKIPKSKDFIKKNYTLVSSKPDEPLAKYVKENVNQYLETVIEHCDDSINDEESTVLDILNNTDVSDKIKEEYINKLKTEITDFNDVENKELWHLLLEQKLIKYTENNVVSYFNFAGQIDSTLAQFINDNNNDLELDYNSIETNFGKNSVSRFCDALISCRELINCKYEEIFEQLKIVHKIFFIMNIPDDKISILINLNVIAMNNDNLEFVRYHYPKHLLQFITKNISDYIETVADAEMFKFEELLSVLEQDVDDGFKIKLLQHTKEKVTINGKNYSEELMLYIIRHNFNSSDIQYLLSVYLNVNDSLKEEIKTRSIDNIDYIKRNKYSIPFSLLIRLLEEDVIDDNTKNELLLYNLIKLDLNQTKESLRILKMSDFLELFEGKRPKFQVNAFYKKILEIFRDKGWISSFDYDKEDNNYYRAVGRKLNEEKMYENAK